MHGRFVFWFSGNHGKVASLWSRCYCPRNIDKAIYLCICIFDSFQDSILVGGVSVKCQIKIWQNRYTLSEKQQSSVVGYRKDVDFWLLADRMATWPQSHFMDDFGTYFSNIFQIILFSDSYGCIYSRLDRFNKFDLPEKELALQTFSFVELINPPKLLQIANKIALLPLKMMLRAPKHPISLSIFWSIRFLAWFSFRLLLNEVCSTWMLKHGKFSKIKH